MRSLLTTDLVEEDARRQVALAALAETAEVRAVHEALEQLYRTQLVAMELADRLAGARGL